MNFKFLRPLFLIPSICLLIACQENKKEAEPTSSEKAINTSPDAKLQLNPQHGLPGHRCDLPVGAPLNSGVSKKQINPTSSPSVSPIRIDQTPVYNPPHGKPYHDCSIPVGAKLKK